MNMDVADSMKLRILTRPFFMSLWSGNEVPKMEDLMKTWRNQEPLAIFHLIPASNSRKLFISCSSVTLL